MKKIKIFLGAFVNYQAAQNINCRSLSEYLDKNKFEVPTFLYPRRFDWASLMPLWEGEIERIYHSK